MRRISSSFAHALFLATIREEGGIIESLNSLTTVQEFEHRLAVWLDNAEFVREYNDKHTSHWVSCATASLLVAAL